MEGFDPDAFIAQNVAQPSAQASTQAAETMGDFDPDAFIQDQLQEKYGGLKQQAIAGVEGAAKGLAGPLATGAEKLLGVKPEDMAGRAEANPITHGVGEAAGLAGGLLTGTGEAALMGKAGEAALAVTGLADAAKAGSLGMRIGSSAVQQAAEMAVLESGNEISKMILQDPDLSAQSAIANIGLSAALGAGTGAFLTGAVSPLWKATAGPKVEELLGALHGRLNGESLLKLPENIENDFKSLGIEPTAFQRADVSDNPTAGKYIRALTRGENEAALAEKADLQHRVSNSVMEPLGTNIDEMKVYDNNEAGHSLKEKITGSIKEKLEPIWQALDKRDTEAALLTVPDDARLALRDRIIERGMANTAGNSKYLKIYNELADQVLEQETIRGFDQMDSQLFKASKNFTQDQNVSDAQRTVRTMLKDFKNSQIEKAALETERAGVAGAKQQGENLLKERQFTNQQYAQAEALREELGDHFGITRPDNSRQFIKAIENDVTPEQMIKKFSIKDNVDGAKFLAKNFPEAFAEVVKNEQKALLKPAIVSAAKKGEVPIDVNKLNDIINKAKSGKSQYLNTVLPPEFINRAEAAARILNATTKAKDSGTPAGMWGLLRNVGTSALASVGWMSGHGAGSSLLLAEMAARLGKDAPEALKLAYLKFLGSTQPIKAEGFKAMVDFLHSSIKGETMMIKAAGAVLKSGVQVVEESKWPSAADVKKLDKIVTASQANPSLILNSQNGHVGHYLPTQQAAATQASVQAVQYLQTLKPHPYQPNPLDKPIQPSPAQEARYHRALEIAQQPAVVLQHVKDGTIQVSDLQDLKGMYPAVYNSMAQKLTNAITSAQSDAHPIPYKTRIGISLFLGQPLDSSMSPGSIVAAQPKPAQQGPQQPQGSPSKSGKPSAMGKTNKSYRTPLQTSEQDRADRD